MSPRRTFLSTAALILALAPPLAAQEMDDRPGIAVMRLDNGGSHGGDAEAENYQALEVGLQQMLLTELSQNPALRVVERGRIADIVEELGLSDQGLVDASTAAQVGQIVGARYMVLGSFFDIGGTMRVDLRIVNAETSEVVNGVGVQGDRAETLRLLVDAADRIAEGVDLPPLPEQVREAREETAEAVPDDGFREYSRALMLIDQGFEEEGMQSLERVVERFPEWDEPKNTLEEERAAVG